MNKWFYFAGGLVVGVVLTLVCSTSFKKDATNSPKPKVETKTKEKTVEQQKEELKKQGITFFDEIGDVVKEKSVKVFQVISADAALVNGKNEYGSYFGTVYLLANSEGKYYYDDEIIEVPDSQEFRQLGIYRYETKNGYKTVPIIGKYNKGFGGSE